MPSAPSPPRTRRRVLEVLIQSGAPLSQTEIATRSALSRTTVAALVPAMERDGLLSRKGERRDQPGRPQPLYRLHEHAAHVVGVVLGKRHLRVGIGALSLDFLDSPDTGDGQVHVVPIPPGEGAGEVLDAAATEIERLLALHGIERCRVVGVGLGLAAPLRRSVHGNGRGLAGRAGAAVASREILPGWEDMDPADGLSARLGGLPVAVDNEANLGALGEHLKGAGRGRSLMVYVKAAYGIGCGIVDGDGVLRGATGTAGELGHIIVDPTGPPDTAGCGKKGCLEAIAGGRAICGTVSATTGQYLALGEIIGRAADEHAIAREDPVSLVCRTAIEEACWHIGVAVAGVCTLLNPDCVVLSGGLSATGRVALSPFRRALLTNVLECSTPATVVSTAVGSRRAELIGAWAHALAGERSLARLDEILRPGPRD